jgi:hypothetical protein
MGQQHNSHVYNNTGTEVYIVLKHGGGESSIFLSDQEVHNFPTDAGNVTLSVFEKDKDDLYFTVASGSRTDASDRSFIVKKHEGKIRILPSAYGDVRKEESGIR